MSAISESAFPTHSACLVCTSTLLRELPNYSRYYLSKCTNCGFVFSHRIPSQQELIDHYDGYGRNDYLSSITIARYNELLDKFERYRKTNRLLDVGCGIGYFLEEAKKRGWEVYGTEYTDGAVKICQEKGISMHQGPLGLSPFQSDTFDIITSFEVIEHINNPREEVHLFQKLLRSGGLAYITTPNFNALSRYRLKDEWDVICYPDHLSYYTTSTLKRLFHDAGFTTRRTQTTGISLSSLRIRKGNDTEVRISASSSDEQLRSTLEKNGLLKTIKSLANAILSLFRKGDNLKGWFEKK